MIKHLFVKGTPLQIGKCIGEEYKEAIRNYILWRNDLMNIELRELGLIFESAKYHAIAPKILINLQRVAPEEFEELKGLSDATGCDLADIVFAIGYTDIFDMYLDNDIRDEYNQECSCFITTASIDKSSYIVCGQNWDVDGKTKDNLCFITKEYSDGTIIFALTTIMGLTHIGMNQFGIAVGTANLSCRHTQPFIIFPVVVQKILRAKSKGDVLKVLDLQRFSGHYYYIGFPENYALSVETTDHEHRVRQYNVGMHAYTHTNHYKEETLKHKGYNYSPSSTQRDSAMGQLLENTHTIEDITGIMGNHEYGLCRHADIMSMPQATTTCSSVIFVPTKKKIYIANDNPCKNNWVIMKE
ncbi:hypothetical protein AGMMS50268_34290 [Spirochaetia bacterium]|nr:hypothetical protein AGMMS50268_34290 [Spirochaetia bacterium]